MSLSPTDTPPVVMSRSQPSRSSAMAAAARSGSSPTRAPAAPGKPSSASRASSGTWLASYIFPGGSGWTSGGTTSSPVASTATRGRRRTAT